MISMRRMLDRVCTIFALWTKRWRVWHRSQTSISISEGKIVASRLGTLDPLDMEIARNTRAAKRSRKTRARGRARQQHFNVEEEDDEAEEEAEQEGRQQRGRGLKPSLPNLAVHFAELSNAVLRRIEDERTNDKRFDEFLQNAKKKLICDLASTYIELYIFYNDPCKKMPDWLSESPPAESFFTAAMDGRLLSKKSQIERELRQFVEELGFVCLHLYTTGLCGRHEVFLKLRLDVATVPTPEARNRVENRLLTFERVLQRRKFSSGP